MHKNKRNNMLFLRYLPFLTVLMATGAAFSQQTYTDSQQNYTDLFTNSRFEALTEGAGRPGVQADSRRDVKRSRLADLNFERIPAGEEKEKPVLMLNLFEDARLPGRFERLVRRGPTDMTWFGSIAGRPGATFSLTVYGEAAVGYVRLGPRTLYEIRYTPLGLHRIRLLDPAEFPDEEDIILEGPFDLGDPAGAGEQDLTEQGGAGPSSEVDNGDYLDVMIVYTEEVALYNGGAAGVRALAQSAVDSTNMVYERNAIPTRVRLVHVEQYSYFESGNCGTDLGRLSNMTDQFFADIHDKRVTYGADVVSLFANTLGGSGGSIVAGCGYQLTSLWEPYVEMFADELAFTVINDTYAVSNFSFTHELGHVQGATHAPNDTPGLAGLYDYSFGNRFGPESDPNRYRTVMAYRPGSRVGWFSDPNAAFEDPAEPFETYLTGVSGSRDNAETLRASRFAVSGFRAGVFTLAGDYAGYSGLASQWGQEECGPCGGADLTLDGNVGIYDLLRASSQWLDGALSPGAD